MAEIWVTREIVRRSPSIAGVRRVHSSTCKNEATCGLGSRAVGRKHSTIYVAASPPDPRSIFDFGLPVFAIPRRRRRPSPAEKVPLFARPVLRALFMWNARSDPIRWDCHAVSVMPAADCCHLRICNELPTPWQHATRSTREPT